MEYFNKAKSVKLRSHLGKYLIADVDGEGLYQSRKSSAKSATWEVELVEGKSHSIRLKSCYGGYLKATDTAFLLGMTGNRVVQSEMDAAGSSWKYEWEPRKEGLSNHVKLRSWCGTYLRGNGGTPPWRNSVTHDDPHSSTTHSWILWTVEVVDNIIVESFFEETLDRHHHVVVSTAALSDSYVRSPSLLPSQEPAELQLTSSDSYVGSPPKMEGRTIYYHVAEDDGEVDDENVQGYSLIFKGNGVEELTKKFEEETGLEGVIVCTRSPLNGKLYPLRLQLPPNNVMMQVVLVLQSSKVAKDFEAQGLL
ncbi:hypothetical protein PIB30_041108 [Stylosanthes scabra]|uniref:DUF569 domain-containing protein n=1 Tax=Stylosanthes scabra TaxID=79078 RepID=A0ABU6QEW3_9FABA|nr:hypothetical protein [Stylosanthes scabra]